MAETPQRLTVRRRGADRIAAGHPWVFGNEVVENLKGYPRGGLVEVASPSGDVLGYGYVNPHSLICARILSRTTSTFDTAFFSERFERADALRQRFRPGTVSYRLCFGESDDLPGLVVDRYDDLFVVQSHAAGVDALLEPIVGGLVRSFSPRGVLLKLDSSARALEGIEDRVDVAYGEVPDEVEVDIEGSRFCLDLFRGQKTGFFHDHALNRARLSQLCDGARVLDLFCYVGAWALSAARGGAREVVGIDGSDDAVRLASRSAAASGVGDRVRFEKADAFADLERRHAAREGWDVVVLDPPAFVKSKKKLREGLRGYRQINRRALSIVRPGGLLATASCSRHVTHDTFVEMVRQAASDSGRRVRIVEVGRQSPDHPIHPHLPDTQYLSCLFLAVD